MNYPKLKLQPVVLCGGSGLRLWPLSTDKIPKQFISLGEKGTLLEETLRRISLVMNKCQDNGFEVFEPLLIMNNAHVLPPELSRYESNVIYEQYANDTAVAVTKVAIEIKNKYQDENILMLVLPADHYIHNVEAFVRDITEGINHVTRNNIILYGIDPTGPETKYGYIITNKDPRNISFREKPDKETAINLINNNALWNSGIFAANVDLILKCITSSNHNIMDWIHNPRQGKAASFDVVVLQEYSDIYAHHCSDWEWSDVGTWDSFISIPEIRDEKSTSVTVSDCNNVRVINRGPNNVVVIGCDDLLVAINGKDILIMSRKGDYNNQLKNIADDIGK